MLLPISLSNICLFIDIEKLAINAIITTKNDVVTKGTVKDVLLITINVLITVVNGNDE